MSRRAVAAIALDYMSAQVAYRLPMRARYTIELLDLSDYSLSQENAVVAAELGWRMSSTSAVSTVRRTTCARGILFLKDLFPASGIHDLASIFGSQVSAYYKRWRLSHSSRSRIYQRDMRQ